jgi:hypothetical protein
MLTKVSEGGTQLASNMTHLRVHPGAQLEEVAL